MHISKDTVNKYVNEYEQHKSRILSENPNADPEELIRNIVEKPRITDLESELKKRSA